MTSPEKKVIVLIWLARLKILDGPKHDFFPTIRARINEERILNRMDSNRLFFMNRLEIDSIWWKYTALGSIGKPRIVLEIL